MMDENQSVYYQNPEQRRWQSGIIRNRVTDRSYLIEGETGGKYVRNRVHIRPKRSPFCQRDEGENEDFSPSPSDFDSDNPRNQNGKKSLNSSPLKPRQGNPSSSTFGTDPQQLPQRTSPTSEGTAHHNTTPYRTKSGRVVKKPTKYSI